MQSKGTFTGLDIENDTGIGPMKCNQLDFVIYIILHNSYRRIHYLCDWNSRGGSR